MPLQMIILTGLGWVHGGVRMPLVGGMCRGPPSQAKIQGLHELGLKSVSTDIQ